MKTLVDTCVWSLALRRRTDEPRPQAEHPLVAELKNLVQQGEAALIGPVRQEVLSGIRDAAQFARIEGRLEPFRDEQIISADYTESARLFNLCRSKGVECGAIDILLCAIAVRLSCAILTNDQGLLRCITALRSTGIKI